MRLALVMLAAFAVAGPAAAFQAGPRAALPPAPEAPRVDDDAAAFLQRLVDHYHRLHRYRDVVRVTRTVERAGARPQRLDSALVCTIEGGRLEVHTPARQIAGALGLRTPLRFGATAAALGHRYDLWLAPHLVLWEDEDADGMLRRDPDDEDGATLTPTATAAVTVEDRPLVQVTLEAPRTSADDPATTVDLYVNRESMLIERLESAQVLADGTSLRTTLDITPLEVAVREDEPEDDEPVEVTDDPAPAPRPTAIPREPDVPRPAEPSPPRDVPPAPPAGGPPTMLGPH